MQLGVCGSTQQGQALYSKLLGQPLAQMMRGWHSIETVMAGLTVA
ncbi:MAG TPA: hypothetical protein VKM94_11115 [Blastocatellia bacterium]|nr:hypothetical protein [Blastocatellia bacterium]